MYSIDYDDDDDDDDDDADDGDNNNYNSMRYFTPYPDRLPLLYSKYKRRL